MSTGRHPRPTPGTPGLDPSTLALHREAVVADMHTHALINMTYLRRDAGRRHPPPRGWNPLRNCVDLPRALEGGVDVLVFTAYVPFAFPLARSEDAATHRVMDVFDRFVALHRDRVGHARSTADIDRILAQGKLAAVLAIEGGHSLGGRLDQVARYRERGVAYITLTHFVDNGIAAASLQPFHLVDGLTPFGREVVREMNRQRVLVDCSHCTDRAFREVAALSQSPLIATHNGIRAIAGIPRNISDEQIRLVADSGGVVGVIAWPYYLRKHLRAPIEAMGESIEHVASVAGIDHVAIGSDLDGYIWTCRGLEDIAAYPRLTAELVRRGFSGEEVKKVLGGNFLRLLRQAWDRPSP